jgi:hypothetical protein
MAAPASISSAEGVGQLELQALLETLREQVEAQVFRSRKA